MPRHGIRGKGKKRFRRTSDSNHALPISPNLLNLLNREFTVSAPDRVWAGDTTYVAIDEGWLFLAIVIDLFSRQVVGRSLQESMTRGIVIDALRMARFKHLPCRDSGLMFHSDRGSQGEINRSSQNLSPGGRLRWRQGSMATASGVYVPESDPLGERAWSSARPL